MTEIPEKIQVGPWIYRTDVSKDAMERAQGDKHYEYAGCVNYKTQIISLDAGCPRDCLRESLLHEVLHTLFVLIGKKTHEEREELVTQLSPAFLDTLRRNPQLVAFLTEAEDG